MSKIFIPIFCKDVYEDYTEIWGKAFKNKEDAIDFIVEQKYRLLFGNKFFNFSELNYPKFKYSEESKLWKEYFSVIDKLRHHKYTKCSFEMLSALLENFRDNDYYKIKEIELI